MPPEGSPPLRVLLTGYGVNVFDALIGVHDLPLTHYTTAVL